MFSYANDQSSLLPALASLLHGFMELSELSTNHRAGFLKESQSLVKAIVTVLDTTVHVLRLELKSETRPVTHSHRFESEKDENHPQISNLSK